MSTAVPPPQRRVFFTPPTVKSFEEVMNYADTEEDALCETATFLDEIDAQNTSLMSSCPPCEDPPSVFSQCLQHYHRDQQQTEPSLNLATAVKERERKFDDGKHVTNRGSATKPDTTDSHYGCTPSSSSAKRCEGSYKIKNDERRNTANLYLGGRSILGQLSALSPCTPSSTLWGKASPTSFNTKNSQPRVSELKALLLSLRERHQQKRRQSYSASTEAGGDQVVSAANDEKGSVAEAGHTIGNSPLRIVSEGSASPRRWSSNTQYITSERKESDAKGGREEGTSRPTVTTEEARSPPANIKLTSKKEKVNSAFDGMAIHVDSTTINVLCCACETPLQLRRLIKRQPLQYAVMVPNPSLRVAIAKAVIASVNESERMRQSQLMASLLASHASPKLQRAGLVGSAVPPSLMDFKKLVKEELAKEIEREKVRQSKEIERIDIDKIDHGQRDLEEAHQQHAQAAVGVGVGAPAFFDRRGSSFLATTDNDTNSNKKWPAASSSNLSHLIRTSPSSQSHNSVDNTSSATGGMTPSPFGRSSVRSQRSGVELNQHEYIADSDIRRIGDGGGGGQGDLSSTVGPSSAPSPQHPSSPSSSPSLVLGPRTEPFAGASSVLSALSPSMPTLYSGGGSTSPSMAMISASPQTQQNNEFHYTPAATRMPLYVTALPDANSTAAANGAPQRARPPQAPLPFGMLSGSAAPPLAAYLSQSFMPLSSNGLSMPTLSSMHTNMHTRSVLSASDMPAPPPTVAFAAAPLPNNNGAANNAIALPSSGRRRASTVTIRSPHLTTTTAAEVHVTARETAEEMRPLEMERRARLLIEGEGRGGGDHRVHALNTREREGGEKVEAKRPSLLLPPDMMRSVTIDTATAKAACAAARKARRRQEKRDRRLLQRFLELHNPSPDSHEEKGSRRGSSSRDNSSQFAPIALAKNRVTNVGPTAEGTAIACWGSGSKGHEDGNPTMRDCPRRSSSAAAAKDDLQVADSNRRRSSVDTDRKEIIENVRRSSSESREPFASSSAGTGVYKSLRCVNKETNTTLNYYSKPKKSSASRAVPSCSTNNTNNNTFSKVTTAQRRKVYTNVNEKGEAGPFIFTSALFNASTADQEEGKEDAGEQQRKEGELNGLIKSVFDGSTEVAGTIRGGSNNVSTKATPRAASAPNSGRYTCAVNVVPNLRRSSVPNANPETTATTDANSVAAEEADTSSTSSPFTSNEAYEALQRRNTSSTARSSDGRRGNSNSHNTHVTVAAAAAAREVNSNPIVNRNNTVVGSNGGTLLQRILAGILGAWPERQEQEMGYRTVHSSEPIAENTTNRTVGGGAGVGVSTTATSEVGEARLVVSREPVEAATRVEGATSDHPFGGVRDPSTLPPLPFTTKEHGDLVLPYGADGFYLENPRNRKVEAQLMEAHLKHRVLTSVEATKADVAAEVSRLVRASSRSNSTSVIISVEDDEEESIDENRLPHAQATATKRLCSRLSSTGGNDVSSAACCEPVATSSAMDGAHGRSCRAGACSGDPFAANGVFEGARLALNHHYPGSEGAEDSDEGGLPTLFRLTAPQSAAAAAATASDQSRLGESTGGQGNYNNSNSNCSGNVGGAAGRGGNVYGAGQSRGGAKAIQIMSITSINSDTSGEEALVVAAATALSRRSGSSSLGKLDDHHRRLVRRANRKQRKREAMREQNAILRNLEGKGQDEGPPYRYASSVTERGTRDPASPLNNMSSHSARHATAATTTSLSTHNHLQTSHSNSHHASSALQDHHRRLLVAAAAGGAGGSAQTAGNLFAAFSVAGANRSRRPSNSFDVLAGPASRRVSSESVPLAPRPVTPPTRSRSFPQPTTEEGRERQADERVVKATRKRTATNDGKATIGADTSEGRSLLINMPGHSTRPPRAPIKKRKRGSRRGEGFADDSLTDIEENAASSSDYLRGPNNGATANANLNNTTEAYLLNSSHDSAAASGSSSSASLSSSLSSSSALTRYFANSVGRWPSPAGLDGESQAGQTSSAADPNVRVITHGVADDGTIAFGVIDTPSGCTEGIKINKKQAMAAAFLSLQHVTVIGTDAYGRAVVGGTVTEYTDGIKIIDTSPHYTRRLRVIKLLFMFCFFSSVVLACLALGLPYFEGNNATWYTLYLFKAPVSAPATSSFPRDKVSYGSLPDCADIGACFVAVFVMILLSAIVIIACIVYFYSAVLPSQQALLAPSLPIVLMIPQVFLTFVHISGSTGVCGNRMSISGSADYALKAGAWCQVGYIMAFVVGYFLLVTYEYIHVYRYQQLPVARGIAPSRRLSGSTPVTTPPPTPRGRGPMLRALVTMLSTDPVAAPSARGPGTTAFATNNGGVGQQNMQRRRGRRRSIATRIRRFFETSEEREGRLRRQRERRQQRREAAAASAANPNTARPTQSANTNAMPTPAATTNINPPPSSSAIGGGVVAQPTERHQTDEAAGTVTTTTGGNVGENSTNGGSEGGELVAQTVSVGVLVDDHTTTSSTNTTNALTATNTTNTPSSAAAIAIAASGSTSLSGFNPLSLATSGSSS